MGLSICQTIDCSIIPDWNSNAVLPYVMDGFEEANFSHSSPYLCSIENFYNRFCYTTERLELFTGLLTFRNYIYANIIPLLPGLTGFQWINGSFCQDKETSMNCPPNDTDVWTAFSYNGIPTEDKKNEILKLINSISARKFYKNNFKVDAFFSTFYNEPDLFSAKMKSAAYWCGLWSHTRGSSEWKGFCQIALDPSGDSTFLDNYNNQ